MTINVSEHGMYLFAATNLSLGTTIEVALRHSGRTNFWGSGIVRRKALYLYGIEFPEGVIPVGSESYLVHTGSE